MSHLEEQCQKSTGNPQEQTTVRVVCAAELAEWLKCALLSQRTRVQSPEPASGFSYLPITPAPEDPMPRTALVTGMHMVYTHTDTHKHVTK